VGENDPGRAARARVSSTPIYDWPKLFDPSSHSGEALKFYAQPDSAMASWAALGGGTDHGIRISGARRWPPTLKSQTYLTETGRLAWQLPISLQAKVHRDGEQRGRLRRDPRADARDLGQPIHADRRSDEGIRVLRQGYCSAANLGRTGRRRIQAAGVQALAKAVPNARIESSSRTTRCSGIGPADVIRAMNEFSEWVEVAPGNGGHDPVVYRQRAAVEAQARNG